MDEATVIYWKVVSEHIAAPFYVSGNITHEDMLEMANAISKANNCVVVVQNIRRDGYGEENVIWQRYLINGLDSFGRETDKQKAPKVSKNGKDVRRPAKGKAASDSCSEAVVQP